MTNKLKPTSAKAVKTPRGIRNNNPLNVRRYPNSSWVGMKAEQTDEDFLQFTDIVYGYRATLIIIARTYRKRGWNTVESILTHYAPSTENNTKAYISAVVPLRTLPPRVILGALSIATSTVLQTTTALFTAAQTFGRVMPLPRAALLGPKRYPSALARQVPAISATPA